MVRVRTAAVLASLLGTAACAHTAESASVTSGGGERIVVAVDERSATTQPAPLVAPGPEVEVEVEAPRPRPRLTRTVTLGQGNESSTYTEAPRPAAGQAAPSVVVNNQIVVQQTASMVGGYGYGYRGYGARGPAQRVDPRGAWGAGAGSPWGSSGFEGPRRTAAPGQTPGVGGNWAPAPSFGPAAMR